MEAFSKFADLKGFGVGERVGSAWPFEGRHALVKVAAIKRLDG